MADILIVDDEFCIRSSLGAFVEADGHTVYLAGNAAEAVAHMQATALDVMVTDIILPQRTGLELLAEVRKQRPHIQVIMITGEPGIATASEAIRQGAFDYLSKPISKKEIIRAVNAAVNKKQLLDQNRRLEMENLQYREQLEQLVSERTHQLGESETRYQSLFASIADPVLVIDAETHRFLDCNDAALAKYGYTMDELHLMTPANLHTTETSDHVHEMFAGQANMEPNIFVHITKAGTSIPVEVHSSDLTYRGHPAKLSIVRDISARARAEERTKRLLAQQMAINELAQALGSAQNLETIYFTIYERVSQLMDATAFIISFYDEAVEQFTAGFLVDEGTVTDVSHFPPIPLEKKGNGSQSQVIHTGKPVNMKNWHDAFASTDVLYTFDENGDLTEGPPAAGREHDSTQSGLLVPMKIEGAIIGVLQVQSHRVDAYSQSDENLLAGMANVASIAIQNSRLHAEALEDSIKLQAAFRGTIEALTRVASSRDPYTASHQTRVAELASAIAADLGLSSDTIELIQISAVIHDIGKLAVPSELLSKPSALTDVEYRLIQAHVDIAYNILKKVDFPWPVADVVRQHHERMDGSGYPRGISADELTLEARIIGVADVVEAMSSHRPYRAALGIDTALEEIKAHSGSLYDSEVAAACLRVFANGFAFSHDVSNS